MYQKVLRIEGNKKVTFERSAYSDNLENSNQIMNSFQKGGIFFGNYGNFILSESFRENSRKWNSREQVHITKRF